jgi:hypothetical protein
MPGVLRTSHPCAWPSAWQQQQKFEFGNLAEIVLNRRIFCVFAGNRMVSFGHHPLELAMRNRILPIALGLSFLCHCTLAQQTQVPVANPPAAPPVAPPATTPHALPLEIHPDASVPGPLTIDDPGSNPQIVLPSTPAPTPPVAAPTHPQTHPQTPPHTAEP